MHPAAVTLFICVSCRGKQAERPGELLFEAVRAGLKDGVTCHVAVTPVECLSVCKRPCTIALTAVGKWTYVVGDLDHTAHADDVIATAVRYGTTDNGIIPWRERPASFRKGVVSRTPPLGFVPKVPDQAAPQLMNRTDPTGGAAASRSTGTPSSSAASTFSGPPCDTTTQSR